MDMRAKSDELHLAPLGVTIVEDNPALSALLRACLTTDFGENVLDFDLLETFEEVQQQLTRVFEGEMELSPLIVADLSLPGAETPVEDFATILKSTAKRVAMVLMSGSSVDHMEALRDQLENDLLKIWILPKPFRMDAFFEVISQASSYLLGEDVPGPEVSSASFIPPIEGEEPLFTWKLSDFDDLRGLVSALPYHPSSIQFYEGIFGDLVELVDSELCALEAALNVSYYAFYSRWVECFSTEEEFGRRSSLLHILKSIPGAEFVLDVCIHDVNNLLTPYVMSGRAPEGKEWSELKPQLTHCIDRSLRPFSRYSMNKNPESFWERQSVEEALSYFENGDVTVDSDVDEEARIYFPAGALVSVIRTFYSNFKKVQRLTGQEDGHLNIYVRQVNGRVRLYFEDNLKPFDDDVFPKLFDSNLPSEQGQGMGTGLLRTSAMMGLDNVRGLITSFHKRGGVWMQKLPNDNPRFLDVNEFDQIASYLQEDSMKVFALDFPIVQVPS